jgi:hypothetical protein
MLDKLIKEMTEKGLMAVAPLGFKGKARPVLDFLGVMVDTEEYHPDPEQWEYLVAGMVRDGGVV